MSKLRARIAEKLRDGKELSVIDLRRALIGPNPGFWRDLFGPSFGRIYAELEKMEQAGQVTHRPVPGGPERDGRPRKLYRLQSAPVRPKGAPT